MLEKAVGNEKAQKAQRKEDLSVGRNCHRMRDDHLNSTFSPFAPLVPFCGHYLL